MVFVYRNNSYLSDPARFVRDRAFTRISPDPNLNLFDGANGLVTVQLVPSWAKTEQKETAFPGGISGAHRTAATGRHGAARSDPSSLPRTQTRKKSGVRRTELSLTEVGKGK